MSIEQRYENLIEDYKYLKKEKRKLKNKSKRLSKQIKLYTETRYILNKAIKIIHEKFKEDLENIITKYIKDIFDRNLKFELRYEEKRNTIESKIIIKENGEELDPKDEMGGSIIDIISFIFRIILWHMSSPRSRNVFILDEPFKFVGDMINSIGYILRELSQKLKFQIILTTHDKELMKFADAIFKVSYDGIKSTIIKRRV